MINYEEELKKFEPCQDVDDAENAIYRQDLTDVVDIPSSVANLDQRYRICGRVS